MGKGKWLLLLIIFIAAGCWFVLGGEEQGAEGSVRFGRQGADISLAEPQAVSRVAVSGEGGQPLVVAGLGPGMRQKIPIFMKWEPGRKYYFTLTLADGGSVVLATQSPNERLDRVSLNLRAPYGLSSKDGGGVVPEGSVLTADVLVTNNADQPVEATLVITVPNGLEVVGVLVGLRAEGRDGTLRLTGRRRLSARNEHWNEQLQLRSGKAGTKAVLQASLALDDGRSQWRQSGQAVIRTATMAGISGKIRISAVEAPVDSVGRVDPKAQAGVFVYTPPSLLSNIWGVQTGGRLDDEPFAYAKVELSNDGDERVLALVSGKVVDPATGELAASFRAPPHKNGGKGYSYDVAAVGPRSSNNVILPIYLNENSLLDGNYVFRVETAIFGVSQVLAGADRQVQLVARSDRPLLVTLVMALVALTGTGWLLWRQEAALARFSTKELVVISLFGTVTFVTVNMPQTVLWDIAHVVFGPFSFLFTGIFGQTVLYALIVSLAAVLPRPGAVTLMIVVRMILNGFIFGHFTPVQILSYAMLAACLEGALYLAGATRGQRKSNMSNLVMIALACGLVDVVTTYMNFMAYMTLYRLYYADWYIGAVIAAGFVYTAAGAAIGCRLGETLRRTATD